MSEMSEANKKAWEYRAYEFWNKHEGTPEEAAGFIAADPMARLKRHGRYFGDVRGKKVANLCGSNGRRAVALALLGAGVTVFDISEENKRYALELAACANVRIEYVLGDLYDIDIPAYGGTFDMLYLEGGIMHYFCDLTKLMQLLFSLLKPGGAMVLDDFHPLRKIMLTNYNTSTIGDYFNTEIHRVDAVSKRFFAAEEQENFPPMYTRLYTLSDIINAVIRSGFVIREFLEHPSWTNVKIPGEFTVYAEKPANGAVFSDA